MLVSSLVVLFCVQCLIEHIDGAVSIFTVGTAAVK